MERVTCWLHTLRKIAPERLLLAALLLLAAGLWIAVAVYWPRPLTVTAFAVGEGDALLVRAPSGRTILIDGGSRTTPEVGSRLLVPNLLYLGVRRLDAILITHPDSDHINALPAVMNAVPVGMLLDPMLPCETATYQELLTTAERKQIPHKRVGAGDVLQLGDGITLRVLAPAQPPPDYGAEDDNDNSVVCLLQDGQSRMLFTGDLQAPGEQTLLESGQDLRADVLKVGHHGSLHGTTEAFLQAVDPTMAVISTKGEMARDLTPVVGRLKARGITVLRTDAYGQITLQTDGTRWRVQGYRAARNGE